MGDGDATGCPADLPDVLKEELVLFVEPTDTDRACDKHLDAVALLASSLHCLDVAYLTVASVKEAPVGGSHQGSEVDGQEGRQRLSACHKSIRCRWAL